MRMTFAPLPCDCMRICFCATIFPRMQKTVLFFTIKGEIAKIDTKAGTHHVHVVRVQLVSLHTTRFPCEQSAASLAFITSSANSSNSYFRRLASKGAVADMQ